MQSKPKALPAQLDAGVKAAVKKAIAAAGSQRAVAEQLDISTATLSLLINDRYIGDVQKMEARMRGLYMSETVVCPVMGAIGRHHCQDYQSRPLAFTNPLRARIHNACKTCPHKTALFRKDVSHEST